MIKTLFAAATLALVASPAYASEERNTPDMVELRAALKARADEAINAAIARSNPNRSVRRYEDYRQRRTYFYRYVPREPRRGYYSPEEYERFNYGYSWCLSETRVDDQGYSYHIEVCK